MNQPILFIARNIPLPGIDDNDVIFEIAEHLSDGLDVEFAYPAEVLPPIRLYGRADVIRRLPSRSSVRGFEVDVYRYLRLPTVRGSYALLRTIQWLNWRKFARARRFRVIHAHYALPDGYLARAIGRRYRIPYVVSVRAGDLAKMSAVAEHSRVGRAYRRVLGDAAAVLALSQQQQEFLSERGIASRLVPHGIPRTAIGNDRSEARATPNPLTIATVCRMVDGKSVDWCIRAIADYRGPISIRHELIGEGPRLESWKQLAANLSVENVHFRGRLTRSDVADALAAADIFALPSLSESFGLVFLEAMANRCATIGIAGTGVSGMFENGREMLFAEPSYESFRDALHQAIDNEALRRSLQETGAQRVHRDFMWEAVIPHYRALYAELLPSSSSAPNER